MELLNPLSLQTIRRLFPEKIFRAVCLSTDVVGDCVYIRGDLDPSGYYRVGQADPAIESKVPAVGILFSKDSLTDCLVQWFGEYISGDLIIPGANVWVGLDGRPTQDYGSLTPPAGTFRYYQCLGLGLSSDRILLNPNFESLLSHKAGIVAAESFTGSPKKASVTFLAAFSDANYAVVVTPVMTADTHDFALWIESQTSVGFTINSGSDSISDLIQVNWVAMKIGEGGV